MVQYLDFMVLPLIGCDVILGIQWLKSLGPITWDFDTLQMQFQIDQQKMTLFGVPDGTIELASKKQLAKMSKAVDRGTCTMLMTVQSSLQWGVAVTNKALSPTAVEELYRLLDQFSVLFEEPSGLPPRRKHDHQIPLKDETQVVKIKPYRYPTIQKDEIGKMIVEMKTVGTIRDSHSFFASLVVLVKKKDGAWRLCIDYRHLNKLTIKDKFPIPLIEKLLDELAHAQWFSKLDLRSGYHQIRMQEKDIHKTAFRTHHGHYEFLVMPFGLTNAPSTFQGLMNHVFEPYLRKFIIIFFDDLLIYSPTWSSHLQHISMVFSLLLQHQLYVKLSKCDFGASQIEYLGHVICGICKKWLLY